MSANDAFSSMENRGGRGLDGLEASGRGRLVPLKTTLETRKRDRVVEVYVMVVPVKEASGTLSLIRRLVPDDGGLDFQHLRRFAKLTEVPDHVRDFLTLDTQIQLSTDEEEPPRLLLIVGPVSAVSLTDLTTATGDEANIFKFQVPLLAPTSLEQAKTWTAQYWPTVYKKSNPFGPHPSIVSRAEEEIRDEVQKWMDLAHDVAREANESGCGENFGVVVVERKAGKAKIVGVAGDARWKGCGMSKRGGGAGNVTAHAVMRVIGMVAVALRARDEQSRNLSEKSADSKDVEGSESQFSRDSIGRDGIGTQNDPAGSNESRRPGPSSRISAGGVFSSATPAAESDAMHESSKEVLASGCPSGPPSRISDNDIFLDRPILPLEKQHFDPEGNQNGYLCHDLEIYCTHEPCIMCSMAIVHSRFGKVVFGERMSRTGGLCADGELGHGLAWRKELNWTLLAWQWWTEEGDGCGGGLHA